MGLKDQRFGRLIKDPRFKRPKKNQVKVQIDSRFAGMMDDPDFEQSARVDSRGRSMDVATSKSVDLKNFYKLEEEEEIIEAENVEEAENLDMEKEADLSSGSTTTAESEPSDSKSEEEELGLEEMARVARGEIMLSSSDEEDEDDDVDIQDGVMKLATNGLEIVDMSEEEFEDLLQTENVPKGDPARRFAVVNMDWDNISAVDLLKLFDGFKPAGGVVLSVKIYPSEFGRERMAREDVEGPPAEIFQPPTLGSDDDEDEEDDEVQEKLFKNDDGEELNEEALRKYQLERLRYYYAVVECDSVETAKHIFAECDGTEYETSSVNIDLRYIPDEMDFEEETVKEVATEVRTEYNPREFTTHVLQHSKPKLTWDEDDQNRLQVTKKQFSKEDIKNMDFTAYLASENESDEEDEEALKHKYRALLLGDGDAEDGDEDAEGDMEVTFAPGLSSKASKLLEKKMESEKQKDETVFETQLRKQKERKKEKKQQKTSFADKDALQSDGEHSDLENDPFFQGASAEDEELEETENPVKKSAPVKKDKNGKKKRRELTEEERKAQAELELLLLDDEESQLAVGKKHFDYEEIVKTEKKAQKKGKKVMKNMPTFEDDFSINTSDPRFEALYESPQFAIDPTNAKFKKTKAMTELLDARNKRRKVEFEMEEQESAKKPATKEREDLSYLVKKLKGKDIKRK